MHDGPAQLISVALLHLEDPVLAGDGLHQSLGSDAAENRSSVRAVLNEALRDIRNIAAGLAVPEIDGLSLTAALQDGVERHRRLTGTSVAFRCGALPDPVPHAVKLCAFRFVQECLSNSFRHAGGAGQSVAADMDGDDLLLRVADRGAGRSVPGDALGASTGLGLKGLRDRIESLGGSLDLELGTPQGTHVTARIPIAPGNT